MTAPTTPEVMDFALPLAPDAHAIPTGYVRADAAARTPAAAPPAPPAAPPPDPPPPPRPHPPPHPRPHARRGPDRGNHPLHAHHAQRPHP